MLCSFHLLNDVIKDHAPAKERKSKIQKPPYMNGELRRSIFKKHTCFVINTKNLKPAQTGKITENREMLLPSSKNSL